MRLLTITRPELYVEEVREAFTPEEKVQLLRYDNLKDRMYRLIQILNREVRLAEIKHAIQVRTREDIDRQQRDYFLHQQIKNIQEELGDGQESEVEELRKKGLWKLWPKEVAASINTESTSSTIA